MKKDSFPILVTWPVVKRILSYVSKLDKAMLNMCCDNDEDKRAHIDLRYF